MLTGSDHSAPRSAARLATGLCFVLPLALYTLTASRTAQGGDTTEFALIGMLGGVAHPPGYPLYSLLARLGTMLPLGPPFFRMAMVSALCGAAAVAVLQRVTWRLTGHLHASVLAALAFAVCREQWRLAGVPEVFTLNALAASLLLLESLRFVAADARRRPWSAVTLGLIFGLGLSNHLTLVLCAPMLAWAFLAVGRHERWSRLGSLLALFLVGTTVGLLPYVELLWAARTAGPNAPLWGATGTWHGLLRHVLRQDYGTFRLSTAGQPAPVRHLKAYLSAMPSDLGFVWLGAALAGIALAWKQRRGFAIALLATLLLSGVVFISRFNLPDDLTGRATETRFYLLPHLLLFPFAAFGVSWLIDRVRGPVAVVIAGAALILPTVRNYSSADWRYDTTVERTLIALVDGMQPHAVFIGQGDVLLPGMTWVTQVLGIRPDVRYIDANVLPAPWYFERVQRRCPECGLQHTTWWRPPIDLAAGMADRVPVYLAHTGRNVPGALPVRLEPVGLVDRVVPAKTPMITLAEVLRRLDNATRLVEPPSIPVDAWSVQMDLAIGNTWQELAEQYKHVGREDAAAACAERAAEFLTAQ